MNIVAIIILLIIILLVAWVCVHTLKNAIKSPSIERGAAACGQCSYEIADLSFDRCPECGGKFLEVGIVTPSLTVRRGSSVMGLIASWTAIVAFFALVSFGIANWIWYMSDANLPRGANSRRVKTFDFVPGSSIPVQSYSLTIESDLITGQDAQLSEGTIDISMEGPNSAISSMRVDAVSRKVVSVDSEQIEPGQANVLSHADALTLYERAGLDIGIEAHQIESKQVVEVVGLLTGNVWGSMPIGTSTRGNTYSSGGIFIEVDDSAGLNRVGSSSSGGQAPPVAIVAGLNREDLLLLLGGGFWLIVYIVGLRLMLLGRKRALQTTG